MSITTTIAQRATHPNVVWAAWSTIAGGVLQTALGVINPPNGSVAASVGVALSSLSHLLLLVGMLGLSESGALGRGRLALRPHRPP
jgi:hypothetical protein